MLFQIVIVAAGALIGATFMILHSLGPAVFLAAISPFDAIFSSIFGLGGNLITFLPMLLLLLTSSPRLWVTVWFGSRIQQALFLFILALSISHFLTILAIPEAGVLEYLRKLTLFLIVGVLAWYMRSAESVLSISRTLVLSTTVFTVISMADFYLGLGLMPGVEVTEGVYGTALDQVSSEHTLRYRGGGLPINRTANWLIVPSFLAFGWFMQSRRGRSRTLALLCTIVCVTGIFATVGRSAILATLIGFVMLLRTAVGIRLDRLIAASVAVSLIGAFGLLVMWQLGFLDLIESRFVGEGSEGSVSDRLAVYTAAIRIWMTSPVFGVGDSLMHLHPLYIGVGAHNSFLGLLAEAGLFGLLPYLVLTIMILLGFLARSRSIDPAFEAWRPYFFAGWAASMIQNMFNDYTWERLIWLSVAYLIAYERMALANRAEARAASPSFDTGMDGSPLAVSRRLEAS